MNVVTGIIIFIVGAIAGFIAARFLSASAQDNKKLEEQVNQSEIALSKYKQDVAEHLESSAELLGKMNETCQTAMQQMAQSTKLLQQATPDEGEAMPFFSKETQEQLAQTVNLRHQKRAELSEESITEPPLDYSGNPSGLFEDKTQSVTNTEKAS